MLNSSDIASLVVGALQVALALVVLRGLGRFGRAFPWLGALMIFFLLRGGVRIYEAFGSDQSRAVSLASDWALVVILVLLILGLGRTVAGLRAAADEADFRREEYARALTDYRALARHRLANPLAVIRGGIATLRSRRDLDDDTREQVLDAIDRQAADLERIALEPRVTNEAEDGLAPAPKLEAR